MRIAQFRRLIPRPLQGKLRLRARLAPILRLSSAYRTWEKRNAELEFWVQVFDARFRESRFWMDDVEELLREAGEWPEGFAVKDFDYSKLRWLEGRALFLRVIKETGLNDRAFFSGKRVVDIGPGPMGSLRHAMRAC